MNLYCIIQGIHGTDFLSDEDDFEDAQCFEEKIN